jgi:hypothetical protein
MRVSSMLRARSFLALAGLAACADQPATEPSEVGGPALRGLPAARRPSSDAADGIQIADIEYAPKALMNALDVTGRDEIRGTDNGSFCQIWASK